jgi:hypothetical protein
MSAGGTDWLALPGKKKRRKRKASVEAAKKLPHEHKRAKAMVKSLSGNSRMWLCDGEYVYFRPTRVVNGEKVTVANPTTLERHRRFISEGQYTYVETQDDVEIYKVTESSPFARKGMFLGELSDADVRRQAMLNACKRDWIAYTDCLEEMSSRLKGRYDTGMAARVYNDYLQYIDILIGMRGGPVAAERAAGLAGVRKRRGVGSGKLILLPAGKAS